MTTPALPRSASAIQGDLIGLLLTLLALVIAWKLAVPRALPAIPSLPQAACDPQRESCRLTLDDDTRVELRIPDRPIVPNQPFVVEASVAGGAARLLQVEVGGVEVDIASAPAAFAPVASTSYRAQLSLPICTTNRMTWQMTVLLMSDGHYLKWPLRFQTETAGLH